MNVQNIELKESINLPGYNVNEQNFLRVENASILLIENCLRDNQHPIDKLKIKFVCLLDNDNSHSFDNSTSLKKFFDTDKSIIRTLSINISTDPEIKERSGVDVLFLNNGEIKISAFGSSVSLITDFNKIKTEVQNCLEEYSGFIKTIFFNNHKYFNKILNLLTVCLCILIVYYVGLMFYGKNNGVDIDPHLIPKGNLYFKQIELAIKGSSLEEKLNTLLIGQLQSFGNISDVISKAKLHIRYFLFSLAIILIIKFLYIQISRCYPLTLISIGENRNRIFEKIQKKREFWNITVILAIILNIVGGLILNFFF